MPRFAAFFWRTGEPAACSRACIAVAQNDMRFRNNKIVRHRWGHSGRATGPAPLRVGIVVTAQFTLNALANFVDVLRLSSDDGDRSRPIRCQWHIMSATGAPLRASCGVQLVPTSNLVDLGQLDYIAVIGGLLHRGRQIDQTTRSYLLKANEAGVGLLGICTGSFVLCRLGLMKGRKCCVSWYHYRDFAAEFGNLVPVADELYVVDRDRITSAGGVGAALAAAHLVESHLDLSSTQKALHIMQIDKMRLGATLQPAPPLALSSPDNRVTRALLVMEQNIISPITISDLAGRVQTSARNLERLFKRHIGMGPLAAYLKLRLMHAELKLRDGVGLAVIASETGFSGASHLSGALARMKEIAQSKLRLQSSTDSDIEGNPVLAKTQPREFHTRKH
jgi:transcriptional regulator GlxA family with amidase domain